MPISHNSKLEYVRDLCRRLRPFLGEKIDSLLQAYMIDNEKGQQQIEAYLEVLAGKYLPIGLEDTPVPLLPPSEIKAKGEYPLATVVYGKDDLYGFGMRESEWIQHVGIFGRSGAGKTNVGFQILRELTLKGKPVLLFDWKRNYRDLLALPEFQRFEVYTVGRKTAPFTFNPLIPPAGINPKTWLKKIIEVIAHAYFLGDGVLYLLQQSLDAVYEEFGVYDGTVQRWPTLRDVLDKAKNRDAKGREAGWLSSTFRALASLCFGEMDTLVNRGENRNLDHELDALTQSDKVFFIQALLLWIHHKRMTEKSREQFKHAIIIEESHHVLSGERRSLVGGQSIMEITFREIREFGESLIILDQHPSQISVPALGNTYCTICLNLKHRKDISAMGQCMLLEDKERDNLGMLEVGQAIVKIQGRIVRPFMVRIPEFKLRKGTVTDEMVRKRMRAVLEPDIQIRTEGLLAAFEALNKEDGLQKTQFDPGNGLYARFLRDVKDNPDSGVAERYKRLGISVRQGQKLKARLAQDGMIEEYEKRVPTGRIRVIRLSEKGERSVS